MYNISETGNNDLNDYLQNKMKLQNKNTNLVEQNSSENETNTIKSNKISETEQVEQKSLEQDSGELGENIQSEQKRDRSGGQRLGSNDVRNGFAKSERSGLSGREHDQSTDGTQQSNAPKNVTTKHSLDGRLLENSTDFSELDILIDQYKGQKLTNEQVAEVVSETCFVSNDDKILLKDHVKITDELKDICNQFRSGGITKAGRGILDEYYTDLKIVDAVRNLIKKHFKNQDEISILEPSVGTGNFIDAANGLAVKSQITGFEINEITAKIAKVLHPEADINLRSFETEFIDEKGNEKSSTDFSEKYDLVIGNPPYGEHLGFV